MKRDTTLACFRIIRFGPCFDTIFQIFDGATDFVTVREQKLKDQVVGLKRRILATTSITRAFSPAAATSLATLRGDDSSDDHDHQQ